MLRWRGRQDKQGIERGWGRIGVEVTRGEREEDEEEVNGIVHAEGDDVNELKAEFD